ncbi:hypothetical protein MHH52_28565 [Paenibacillus sp. FSL K6-0276]|uniref:hypothetical protein n=1 Tax=Paenibacillus sp. FSL K6-0276 TaxID=2921450 RepID=UPI0030EB532B
MDNKKKPRPKKGFSQDSLSKTGNEKSPRQTEAQELISLFSNNLFFVDQYNEPYCKLVDNGETRIFKVCSKEFKLNLSKAFYLSDGKPPSPDALKQAVNHFEAMAMFDGKVKRLERRVAQTQGHYFYDLCDPKKGTVMISASKYKIITRDPCIFYRTKNMSPQFKPNFSCTHNLINLLSKHFRTQRKSDILLLAIYIISCLVPDISHPLLVFIGEKGAAKSTTMRMVRSIVDPSRIDLLSMPNSNEALALMLNNNYMPAFDNLDYLSPERSDLLCMAATGGSISKRKLYTDDGEVVLNLKRCVMLNGINSIVTRSDLLDRSIVIELKRISPEDRKDERTIWDSFQADLPDILGACFIALSKAMSIHPKVQLSKLPRMADFAKWGYAIGEALGGHGDNFLKYYEFNQKHASTEILSNNPVASSILKFMEDQEKWTGSATTLLFALDHTCMNMGIRKVGKNWPESPNSLTRRMNNLRSNLEQAGIFFECRKNGARTITITNENAKQSKIKPRKKRSIYHTYAESDSLLE